MNTQNDAETAQENIVSLEGRTHRARNRLNEARWDMLKFAGQWTNRWRVIERRDTIQADPRNGPFLLVTPEWDTDDSKHSRWIHATDDKHFRVIFRATLAITNKEERAA